MQDFLVLCFCAVEVMEFSYTSLFNCLLPPTLNLAICIVLNKAYCSCLFTCLFPVQDYKFLENIDSFYLQLYLCYLAMYLIQYIGFELMNGTNTLFYCSCQLWGFLKLCFIFVECVHVHTIYIFYVVIYGQKKYARLTIGE